MAQSQLNDNAVNQGRAMVYRLLSSLFAKEVDRNLLHEITSEQALTFWSQLASQTEFKADVDTLVAVLTQLKSDRDLLELAADYCGLFLVGTKHSASPYASLYLENAGIGKGNEPLLFGEQHQMMVNFLKMSKLQVQTNFPEPADHLAVILAYVAYLCDSDKGSETDAVQLEFIESKLSWLGNFTAKVTTCDTGKFYNALARLTQHWVVEDIKGLREIS